VKKIRKTFKGIDVSVWQGFINFDKVKLSGIDFVIIKAGGSDDDFYTDSCFEINYNNAKKAGLKIGCYYIVGSNFDTIEKGIKNAKHFAKIIKGKTFDYPVFLDLELTLSSQKYGATTASITFCDYLKKLGYKVGIYGSSISGFKDRLDINRLGKYDKWVAQYSSNKPTYPTDCKIWQYSSMGRIDGINCNVDMNISYYDYSSTGKNSNNSTNKITTNANVKAVQKWLNANYNADLIVDGIYGNLTKKALVKALQTELNKQYNANLDIDGIFGIKTKSAIRNISNGTRGNITKILQGLLICNGYSTNGFDGIAGNGTTSAIKSYQLKCNLTIDGIAGKDTFYSLCK
jgi:GH25 family lysozyme M1 (1,4-beta-N-acetylmuramidase)